MKKLIDFDYLKEAEFTDQQIKQGDTLFATLASRGGRSGLSLTELLVALAIAGIVAGTGVSQYGKYMGKAERQDLHDSAKLFVNALKSCISSNGGWHISAVKKDTEINATNPKVICNDTSKSCIAHTHFPCKLSSDANKTVKDKLKETLNYICPIGTEDDDNKCEIIVSTATPPYFCLSIKKELGGDKHQIVALVKTDKSDSKIYCKNLGSGSYIDLTTTNCSKDATGYKAWNGDNTNKQCDWPTPSAATGGGSTTSTSTTTGTTNGGTPGTTSGT